MAKTFLSFLANQSGYVRDVVIYIYLRQRLVICRGGVLRFFFLEQSDKLDHFSGCVMFETELYT